MLSWLNQFGIAVTVIVAVLIFTVAIYAWIKAVRHMWGLLHNTKGKHAIHILTPFSMFMPSLYTDIGNYHRVNFIKYTALFFAVCGIPFILKLLYDMLQYQGYV